MCFWLRRQHVQHITFRQSFIFHCIKICLYVVFTLFGVHFIFFYIRIMIYKGLSQSWWQMLSSDTTRDNTEKRTLVILYASNCLYRHVDKLIVIQKIRVFMPLCYVHFEWVKTQPMFTVVVGPISGLLHNRQGLVCLSNWSVKRSASMLTKHTILPGRAKTVWLKEGH